MVTRGGAFTVSRFESPAGASSSSHCERPPRRAQLRFIGSGVLTAHWADGFVSATHQGGRVRISPLGTRVCGLTVDLGH
jgi:hypothetical protein